MPGPYELELKGREGFYGASELGAMHGVDPNRDLLDLWRVKVEGVTYPTTKRMLYGKYFEESILRVACEEMGKVFRPSFNKTFRHPEYPKYHLVATPDGLPEDENDGGLDCKMVAPDQLHLWSPDEMLPRVELQVRGCMAVTGRPRWYVAVWCGDRLIIYTVERDLEFERFILEHAEEQWRRYFEAKVRPPLTASKGSADWLQRAYPRHKRPDLRPATDEEIEQMRRYGRLKTEQKSLATQRALIENQIKDAIKDREGLVWDGGRFTWRRTRDSHVTNWEGLAQTMLTRHVRLKDGTARDEEACLKLIEDHSYLKPGVRRIWFRSDEFFEEEEVEHAA